MAYNVSPNTRNFIRAFCVFFAVCLIFVGVSGAVPDAVDKLDGQAKATAMDARAATQACTGAGHRATSAVVAADNASVKIGCAYTLLHLTKQTYEITCVNGIWSRDLGQYSGGSC